ncbi:hypothetical protein NPIL_144331 [Nephila pilipes]|uniref:Uncharacterized protein n=1 Tax=Nephila pilipes TaxID=299642 RepID=A0A8X6P5G6_NEPPI|nr:hypothetical protein NPIL_144331 [Nephila pilipes]
MILRLCFRLNGLNFFYIELYASLKTQKASIEAIATPDTQGVNARGADSPGRPLECLLKRVMVVSQSRLSAIIAGRRVVGIAPSDPQTRQFVTSKRGTAHTLPEELLPDAEAVIEDSAATFAVTNDRFQGRLRPSRETCLARTYFEGRPAERVSSVSPQCSDSDYLA